MQSPFLFRAYRLWLPKYTGALGGMALLLSAPSWPSSTVQRHCHSSLRPCIIPVDELVVNADLGLDLNAEWSDVLGVEAYETCSQPLQVKEADWNLTRKCAHCKVNSSRCPCAEGPHSYLTKPRSVMVYRVVSPTQHILCTIPSPFNFTGLSRPKSFRTLKSTVGR